MFLVAFELSTNKACGFQNGHGELGTFLQHVFPEDTLVANQFSGHYCY